MSQSSRAIIATSADGSQTLTIGLARIDPDKDTEASLIANAQETSPTSRRWSNMA